MLVEMRLFIFGISTGDFGNKSTLSWCTAVMLGNAFSSKVDMCMAFVCFLVSDRCMV